MEREIRNRNLESNHGIFAIILLTMFISEKGYWRYAMMILVFGFIIDYAGFSSL